MVDTCHQYILFVCLFVFATSRGVGGLCVPLCVVFVAVFVVFVVCLGGGTRAARATAAEELAALAERQRDR